MKTGQASVLITRRGYAKHVQTDGLTKIGLVLWTGLSGKISDGKQVSELKER